MHATKRCGGCERTLPIEVFNRNRTMKDGRQAQCRECNRQHREANRDRAVDYMAEWYAVNAERISAERRARRAAGGMVEYDRAHHRKYGRKTKLVTRYRMTDSDYDAALRRQRGVCAICKRPERALTAQGRPRRLAVDHDHAAEASGRLVTRGLLCTSCNNLLRCYEQGKTVDPAIIPGLRRFLRRKPIKIVEL